MQKNFMQTFLNPRSPNAMSTLSKDNFYRVMVKSMNKALDQLEAPVKEKHARRVILGSHQAESGTFFWNLVPVLKLKENQIVCWKFCYVLHKILRDGHKLTVSSSYDRRQILLDCGNMWRHVEEGYGQLIFKYCTLLFNRINFLMRNPSFPSDLKVSDISLDNIGDQDPSIFFDLSCEIFDALDDIINLHERARKNVRYSSSYSREGQCLCNPLIICIQDSTVLYDLSVKILFKLHGKLQASTLEGHRTRFQKQHEDLKRFYDSFKSLSFYKTLIRVPDLAFEPPNFLIASDLRKHVAPQVVMISNPEQSSPDQLLVDFQNDDELSICQRSQSLGPSNSSVGIFPVNEIPSQPGSISVKDSCDNCQLNDDRIQELEIMVAQLHSQLDAEKSDHRRSKEVLQLDIDKSKSELEKVRNDMKNLNYQLINSKNAFKKQEEELVRAQHDVEISQIAMRKMMLEMSELRSKQKDEKTKDRIVQLESDAIEANLIAEMNEIDRIIKLASCKIEELSEKSRKVESGVKLQVNEKISEVCTNLMKAVRNLIAQSRILQREIVDAEPGQINREGRYKLNSDWVDGLVSAANVVAMAARSLVDAADRVMSGRAKFTELAAAAHEIAAATTQLVVASRVKAPKDSDKLKLLENSSKQVNRCSSNVVDASRVCANLIEQQEVENIDINTLSLHQTKKLEMESQVRLLELEQELSKERVRLGLLRRKHYEEEDAQHVTNESKA